MRGHQRAPFGFMSDSTARHMIITSPVSDRFSTEVGGIAHGAPDMSASSRRGARSTWAGSAGTPRMEFAGRCRLGIPVIIDRMRQDRDRSGRVLLRPADDRDGAMFSGSTKDWSCYATALWGLRVQHLSRVAQGTDGVHKGSHKQFLR